MTGFKRRLERLERIQQKKDDARLDLIDWYDWHCMTEAKRQEIRNRKSLLIIMKKLAPYYDEQAKTDPALAELLAEDSSNKRRKKR